MRDVVSIALLVLGGGVQLLGSLGVTAMRDPLDRLHYTGASILAAVAVAAAILVREGFSLVADKALLVAAFVIVSSPVLTQVVGRSVRARQRDGLDAAGPDVERIG